MKEISCLFESSQVHQFSNTWNQLPCFLLVVSQSTKAVVTDFWFSVKSKSRTTISVYLTDCSIIDCGWWTNPFYKNKGGLIKCFLDWKLSKLMVIIYNSAIAIVILSSHPYIISFLILLSLFNDLEIFYYGLRKWYYIDAYHKLPVKAW